MSGALEKICQPGAGRSALFFGMRNPGLAFADLVLLWLALLVAIVAFWKARPLAGVLLVPYLAWVTFAGVLNLTLWRLNGSL
jgi:translocator protein